MVLNSNWSGLGAFWIIRRNTAICISPFVIFSCISTPSSLEAQPTPLIGHTNGSSLIDFALSSEVPTISPILDINATSVFQSPSSDLHKVLHAVSDFSVQQKFRLISMFEFHCIHWRLVRCIMTYCCGGSALFQDILINAEILLFTAISWVDRLLDLVQTSSFLLYILRWATGIIKTESASLRIGCFLHLEFKIGLLELRYSHSCFIFLHFSVASAISPSSPSIFFSGVTMLDDCRRKGQYGLAFQHRYRFGNNVTTTGQYHVMEIIVISLGMVVSPYWPAVWIFQ